MSVPQHIAIIMDGNGRWAKKRGLPRNAGHTAGAKNVENICLAAKKLGVKYLTLYAFSTENWSRPEAEVKALMKLLAGYLDKCVQTAHENKMHIRVIGDISRLSEKFQKQIIEAERVSSECLCRCKGRKTRSRGTDGGTVWQLSGYKRTAGSGSVDSYQWGTAFVKLSALAAGIQRVLFYGCAVAGF